MKKFLFATLMVVMGICAHAQIVSSSSSRVVRPVVVKEKKPSTPFEISHYVKWGWDGFSEMTTPSGSVLMDCYSGDAPLSWSLMYGADRPFWQKEDAWGDTYSCLYWGYEVGITRRGFGIDGYEVDDLNDDQGNDWPDYDQIRRFGLQVAPKIGFKWGLPDDGAATIAMGIEVGLYVNYNVKSSYLLTDDKYFRHDITSATSDLLMSAFFDAWNNFDTGISVGAFYILGPIRLELKYVGGLAPSFSGVDCVPVKGYYIPPVTATYVGGMFLGVGIQF